ncbi:MAG: hypothetical protein GQF41_0935 [Candidatus Rifleibacterium amylolyticum]|nr:MAG: hypothetical protein GQF41_0935 [Candidatus Rifleibacterium amylolyticum]NLF97124.1 hypothetical protein [Candidatus Riflebacteria bacterium]
MHKISRRVLLLGLVVTLAVTNIIWAQSPGTVADPLVSKSFVDHFLKFRSIMLPADTTVNPQPGTMLIVRSGQLRLEASKGKSVIDLTAGREIAGGNDLPHNHLIIVPEAGDYVLKARKPTMLLASHLSDEKAP